jgi:hypothetical protein
LAVILSAEFTNIKKHGPSLEPTSRAVRKQVPLTLWNHKVHYNLQNNETLVLASSDINLFQITVH